MDGLRSFLEKRSCVTTSSDCDPWHQLSSKIDQLKKSDALKVSDQQIFQILMDVTGSKVKHVDSVLHLCLDSLCHVSRNCSNPYARIPLESRKLCDAAIDALQLLFSLNISHKQQFIKAFFEIMPSYPLELIWILEKSEILKVSTFVFKKSQSLSDPILWLLTHSKESPENLKIVIDIFASLLVAGQSGPLNLQLSTACAATVRKCLEDILSKTLDISAADQSIHLEPSIDFSYLLSSDLRSMCGDKVMEQFISAHLLYLLNEESVPYSTGALLNAVEIQEKTVLDSVTCSLRDLLIWTVKALGSTEVIHQLGAAAVKPSINWRMIFLVTGSLLMMFPESCQEMKKLTDELINMALEGGRQNELSVGFLLARHCCQCDSKNFSTYSAWFSSHFGPDSVTARNTNQFQFLIKFLTDIVPAESGETLRVQLNKVPQAPTSCNMILNDYTALVRTRLADLNESTELAGLFHDSRQDSLPGLDYRRSDVVRVLRHFQQSQEINKAVLEASIFRRHYFRNVFLVELLGLPGASEDNFVLEQFNLDNDIRHQFILSLQSRGKIPDKLYKAYMNQRLPAEHKFPKISEEVFLETKPESSDMKKRKSLKVKPRKQ